MNFALTALLQSLPPYDQTRSLLSSEGGKYAHVRFTEDFDWKPLPQVTIAYKAGWFGLVTTPCATAAIEANKAVGLTTPNK
ncbi:hypothetical protein [Ochrobactrum quorumnocens]|uniref:hypothetical protein n=1 Tax=Ochrobactrum quorumnocens TaxID=271865 RepID=UPI001F2DF3E3|nr:hypothetical protein [[Ochrobactrum] quorumnocens]